MSRTIFLSRLIGIAEIFISLSMLLHKQLFIALLTGMLQDRPLLFLVAILILTGGLAIILSHNIWSGGVLPIIVTLFGWILFLKGLMSLLCPPEVTISMLGTLHYEEYFYVYSTVPLLIGLYLTFEGFKSVLCKNCGQKE